MVVYCWTASQTVDQHQINFGSLNHNATCTTEDKLHGEDKIALSYCTVINFLVNFYTMCTIHPQDEKYKLREEEPWGTRTQVGL